MYKHRPRLTAHRVNTKAKRTTSRRTFFLSLLICFCALAVGASGILFSSKTPKVDAAAQESGDVSPEALAQIEALLKEKESRTGTQAKMDSQLIYELKMDRGQTIADGIQTLETDVQVSDTGKAAVDITATVSDGLLDQLRADGAEIVSTVPERNSIRALVPLDSLELIAVLPDVKFIQPKQDAMTSGFKPSVVSVDDRAGTASGAHPGYENRAARVRSIVSTALQEGAQPNVAAIFPPTGQGSRTTEGDVTHRAFAARGTFHVDGTGIKIGVLSDGVTNLAASQALGDLGPVTVLPGQAGSGDEGTAMLEIVHDVAPGAQLYFATAFGSITSFANNIRALRLAGCDIIVDDVFYFVETPFQDGQLAATNTNGGVVIQAVNDVTASGALYFSSAGNSGNLNDGTSGVWEGNFVDGGPVVAPILAFEGPAARLHSFGSQTFNVLNAIGSVNNLYWSDPLGGSSNDYDLFRLNAAGTAVQAASTSFQSGTQDPYEAVSAGAVGARLVVVKFSGAARFLHLNTNRGRLSIATTGQTHGHAAAADAYSCAATPANLAFGAPPNPVGPYPNPFNSSNRSEVFTSDGPRRVFFQASGVPYTPGNFLSTGGILRQKPDITAADGVSVTGVGGFPSTFYGTSAAAPHAGAIAALLKSANPTFTPAQIRAALTSSAIDIEAAGTDRDTGAGIVMPYNALQALGVTGTADIEFGTVNANEDPGDGNGTIDAGEGAKLDIQLKNLGVANATGITASLTSSTPGITIQQPNTSAYPDLAAQVGSGFNSTPFRFTVASNAPCPLTAKFTLTVNYSGGPSPKVLSFSVPTGPNPVSASTVLDTVAPLSGTGFTATTGLQNLRIFRDGTPNSCNTQLFPGTAGVGTYRYDAYAFQTCPSSGGGCVTIRLTGGANLINVFSAAYTGSFNPSNIGQNYIADEGASFANAGTYSFNIPAGAQTFVVVVAEAPNSGSGLGVSYNLNVSGACVSACPTPNQVPVAKAKNVIVSAGPDCTANASINDGSFDPDGDPLTITQSPAGPYPLGTTTVQLTVKDPRGATSQATATVTVVDDSPPTVSCPAGTSTSADSFCQAAIPNVVPNVTASDNCTPAGSITITQSPAAGTMVSLGTHKITVTATDAAGNSNSCTTTFTVNDTTAPSVTNVSATPDSLWPPNHKMIPITVNYGSADNCGAVNCVLSVTSNEPVNGQGDGDTAPDWVIVDAHHLLLRSERSGKGNGRVYTITIDCADGSGSNTVKTVTVTVPKNQSGH